MPDISSAKAAKKMKQKAKEFKAIGPVGQTKEGKAKAERDAQAHICALCKQTFSVIAKSAALIQHVENKHSKQKPVECFPELPEMIASELAPAKKAPGKKASKEENLRNAKNGGGKDVMFDTGFAAKEKKPKVVKPKSTAAPASRGAAPPPAPVLGADGAAEGGATALGPGGDGIGVTAVAGVAPAFTADVGATEAAAAAAAAAAATAVATVAAPAAPEVDGISLVTAFITAIPQEDGEDEQYGEMEDMIEYMVGALQDGTGAEDFQEMVAGFVPAFEGLDDLDKATRVSELVAHFQ
jgi:hypothetical protein